MGEMEEMTTPHHHQKAQTVHVQVVTQKSLAALMTTHAAHLSSRTINRSRHRDTHAISYITATLSDNFWGNLASPVQTNY